MIIFIVATLVCLIFTCSLFCGYKSLKKAIDCIDASADFLAGTKRIIGVPIFFFFISIFTVLIWAGAFAAVVSMNDIVVLE